MKIQLKRIQFVIILNLLILQIGCKKDQINLEVDKKLENLGKVITIRNGIYDVKLEKGYLQPDNSKLTDNFAYTDLINVQDSTLMLVTMSSPKNIEDFSSGSIIKYTSYNNGKTWKKEGDISSDFPGSINLSMPSILNYEGGHLILVYLVKYNLQKIDLVMEESFDGGKTWSEARLIHLPNQGYQMINNSRLMKIGNRLVLPVCVSFKGRIVSFFYFSDDKGQTWNKSGAIGDKNIDFLEPGIVSTGGNELLMNIRTNLGGIIFARSFNGGVNWHIEESNFNSPSSPQTIRQIPGTNKLLMVWNNNNVRVDVHGGNRSPLSLAISDDKGKSWTMVCDIEPFNQFVRDHAYPVISFDKKFVYIVYNERNNYTSSFSVKIARIDLKNFD